MTLLFNKELCQDLYRYEGDRSGNMFIRMKYLFCVPGFTYTFFFRHASHTRNVFARLFYTIFLHITKFITHIQIPSGTAIGRGLRIAHFGQIVINPDAVIGDNFTISQGCLVGNSQGKHAGAPNIGSEVYMGGNSIVIGKVHIGNNVLIAPGAFVNFDVPDNSIVIGNPGRIIPRDTSPTANYIVFPVV